jgi:Trk-type K+ transport system membrane component
VIGGFSTHDASMGYFESPLILMIFSGFMLFPNHLNCHYLRLRSQRLFYLAKLFTRRSNYSFFTQAIWCSTSSTHRRYR